MYMHCGHMYVGTLYWSCMHSMFMDFVDSPMYY